MKEITITLYLTYSFVCGILYFTQHGEFNSSFLLIPCFLYVIFIIFKMLNNKRVDWFSIEVIFFNMFYLIHFGYIFMYGLGLVEYDSEVFWSPQHMNQTIFLATGVISIYLFAFSLISPKTEYNKLEFFNENEILISQMAKVLMFLVILMFWLPILSIFNLAFSNYENLIKVGELSSIGKLYWLGQSLAIFPLIITSFYAYKYSKLISITFFMPIFYIFCYLMIGDRGGFLYYIFIPIVLFHYTYRKINIQKFILYLILIAFVSTVLSVSRVNSNYNPFDAVNSYQQAENKKNPIIDTFSEFGTSLKTVNIAVTHFPDNFDYWYGKSYYDSFMLIFPNLMSSRISQGPDAWLTEKFFGKDTYGRGGSILMESFMNFGYLGSNILFLVLGIYSGYIYKKIKYSNKLINIVIYLSFMCATIIWMRNTSAYLFRGFIWTLLLYYLCLMIIPSLKKQRAKKWI